MGQSDLRVQSNWVDGNWVLLQNQMMKEFKFSQGTPVEVNIDPDNSFDVWFPASFIKQVSENTFLVECQSSSSNESGLQKLTVDSLHIRPSPPHSSNKAFNLLEKVDAFYEYRWLSGVVTKILADGRYIVYFKRTKKEKELCHTDLRLHMEWANGKWVHLSQENSVSSISVKKNHAINGGFKEKIHLPAGGTGIVKENTGEETLSAAILRSCQKVLPTSGSENVNYNGVTPRNKRIKQASVNGDSIYLKSSLQVNEKTACEVTLSPEACNTRKKRTVRSDNGMQAGLDTLALCTPQMSSMKQSEDSKQPSASMEIKGDDEKHPARRKRGRPRKLPALVADVHANAVSGTPNRTGVVAPLGSIVLGLTHNVKRMRMDEEPKKAVEDEDKHCNTSADHESVVNDSGEQQNGSEVANLKRKRGRPPKVLFKVGGQKTKKAEFVEEGKSAISDVIDAPKRHSPTDEAGTPVSEVEKPIAVVVPVGIGDTTPIDSRKRHVRIMNDEIKHPSDSCKLNTRSIAGRTLRRHGKILKETVRGEEDINEPFKLIRMGKGRQHWYYKQSEPLTEDDVDESRDGVAEVFDSGVAEDIETVLPGTSSNVSDDDRPLSAWFEGAHTPLTTDGNLLVTETAGQCDERGGKQDQSEKGPAGRPKEKAQEKKDDKSLAVPLQSTAIVQRNNVDLPFVKNSLIWEMIESMEVFKRVPQQPHFRPLFSCKEECREGLAIGNMVTFSSLVERVSRLQFGDPRTLLDGYLEALVDLEEQGFNVTPVRDVLNTLLAIKGRHEQAQNTWKEIESQIMERNCERSKMNEEIAEVDKKIAELKEERALAVSKKGMKDAEIALLQSSVEAVKGSLENAREEFGKVAAALL